MSALAGDLSSQAERGVSFNRVIGGRGASSVVTCGVARTAANVLVSRVSVALGLDCTF